jgi:hypothetical protein
MVAPRIAHMKRRLLVCTLLAVMPFGGMRVFCLDTQAQSPATAAHVDGSDCDRLCVVHHPARSGDTDCSMTADPSSMMVVSTPAVAPAADVLRAPLIVVYSRSEPPFLYLDPGLSHQCPPPKGDLL